MNWTVAVAGWRIRPHSVWFPYRLEAKEVFLITAPVQFVEDVSINNFLQQIICHLFNWPTGFLKYGCCERISQVLFFAIAPNVYVHRINACWLCCSIHWNFNKLFGFNFRYFITYMSSSFSLIIMVVKVHQEGLTWRVMCCVRFNMCFFYFVVLCHWTSSLKTSMTVLVTAEFSGIIFKYIYIMWM